MSDTGLITQPKELIARFVAQTAGRPFADMHTSYTALGWVRRGELIAGLIYKDFTASNCGIHIGTIGGGHWLTRTLLRAIFDYPFNQLGLRRMTAPIAKKNKPARRFAENLGFCYEGCLKHYYPDDDLIVYGMLREKCRHLPPSVIPALRQEAA